MGGFGDSTFKFGPEDSMCLFPSVGAPLFVVNGAGSDRLLHGILEGKTASDEDTEFPEEAEEEDSADRLLFPWTCTNRSFHKVKNSSKLQVQRIMYACYPVQEENLKPDREVNWFWKLFVSHYKLAGYEIWSTTIKISILVSVHSQ